MLHSALSAFMDAIHLLLRNQVEKRAVLENLDCVILCLDETIDDGCVLCLFFLTLSLMETVRVGLSLRRTRRRSRRG
jgi:hypothetical protein